MPGRRNAGTGSIPAFEAQGNPRGVRTGACLGTLWGLVGDIPDRASRDHRTPVTALDRSPSLTYTIDFNARHSDGSVLISCLWQTTGGMACFVVTGVAHSGTRKPEGGPRSSGQWAPHGSSHRLSTERETEHGLALGSRADSSGRRNACVIIVTVERRKPLPVLTSVSSCALARPIVEKVLDPSQVVDGEGAQVGALGKVLAKRAVRLFVCTACHGLPGSAN